MRLKPFNVKKEKNPVTAQSKRNKILLISLIGLCILTVLVYQTYAIYQLNNEANLTNTKVGEFTTFDIKLIAYIDNEKSDTFPNKTDGYVFEKAECTEGATGSWDSNTWSFITGNLTKPTECNVYFKADTRSYCEKNDITILKDCIIATNGGPSVITELATTIFASIASTEATSGLFKMTDDYGTSYYFRGHRDYINNNVIFAGFQWKIIRINGDGSIRMIYNGTEAQFNTNRTVNTIETSTTVSASQLTHIGGSAFNTSYNDNTYVGYKYGATGKTTYATTHTNTTNSTIKTAVDNWYRDNIANQGTTITNRIVDRIFCNDRQPSTSTTGINGSGGYGSTETYYATHIRLSTNKNPKLTCTQDNDKYTVASGRLSYPVGLITADEISLAGGVYGITNTTFYLYTNQNYWTMSPVYFNNSRAYECYFNYAGSLFNDPYYIYYVSSSFGIRPVINLAPTVTISSGDGSASVPYIIS